MRPEILFPLFADVQSLPGVGPKVKLLLAKLAGTRILDLLWHIPVSVIDRRFAPPILQAPDGAVVTLEVTIDEHLPPPPRSRRPYRVVCSNESGFFTLAYFSARPDYLAKMLPVGEKRVVSGKLERYEGKLQMPHPDYVVPLAERDTIPAIEPVYPLTAGITNRQLVKLMRAVMERVPALPEWDDVAFKKQKRWMDWKGALELVHNPDSLSRRERAEGEGVSPSGAPQSPPPDLPPTGGGEGLARERLAYDEILANQLALGITRVRVNRQPGTVIDGDKRLRKKLLKALPFALTGGQIAVLKDIGADMKSGTRMVRLLQGDVGSGKTVVALLAMLNAVECGGQAALMAPTGILARQHYAWLGTLAEQVGFTVVLLTGAEKGKVRQDILARLVSGEIDILVGTHALFQKPVAFKNLALAVIDEQHRFGVDQRLQLTSKGRAHILLMSATPIPRSLTMVYYGDMDSSRLSEKPAQRQPIDTRVMPLAKLPQVLDGLKRAIKSGDKVYWICPLVEESELVDLAAATDRHREFQHLFGAGKVGLVHGRMAAEERSEAMAKFIRGDTSILVATTVIEVGVDVPDATIMVIEYAERFGLSQLHQLRGRVGRGSKKSNCILLYADDISKVGAQRLGIMRDTDDGFRIAEEDLHIRGGGEILGTKQSGLPTFRFTDLYAHRELIQTARDDAKLILNNDPELESARGKALRVLLYLFEYDAQIRYLRSG